jgi:ribonuclease HI
MRDLSWDHVRAHRGHRWNERADHLAKRAMRRERPEPLTFWKPGQD